MSDSAPPPPALAAILSGSAEPEDGRAMLLFETGDKLFALDASGVELIVPWRFTTPVPFAPRQLLGIASVMGRMRLIIDPLGGGERHDGPRRLIVLHGDAQLAVAADRVIGVRTIAPDEAVEYNARAAEVLDPERLIDLE